MDKAGFEQHSPEIGAVLARIQAQLSLEAETEHELLEEIRGHLEEAVDDARARGLDEGEALSQAADRFGVAESARELQKTHAGWGTLEGIAAAALPVLFALVFRWLMFSPDGTVVGWPEMLQGPPVWFVAGSLLLIPLLRFPRRRYALVAWAIFWSLSIIMLAGPTQRW